MTPEQKIEYIEAQIAACERSATNVITCPYCKQQNQEGEPLCCETFAKAAMAIIQRQSQQQLMDDAARIAEKVAAN